MILSRIRHGWLLLASLLLSFIAFWQMIMRVKGTMPPRYIIGLSVVALLVIALTLLVGQLLPYSVQAILPCIVLLSGIGVTMIARIDLEKGLGGISSDIGIRQLMWIGVAVVLSGLLVLILRDYRQLRRFSYTCLIIGVILLLSPMLPGIGQNINGSRVWIRLAGFSMQPSEFAKLFLAVFFASYLFDHRDTLAVGGPKILGIHFPRLRDFGPILVVFAITLGSLALQNDLGTPLMFFIMFVAMLYAATRRASWLIIGGGFFVVAVALATKLFPHFAYRVSMWLDPLSPYYYNRNPGSGQIVSGLFGLASGGLTGTGLGRGYPNITPFANSDFIYASLGEELGLIGLLAILLLYLIIIGAGFITAMKIKDGFGKLLVSGLVFSMAFQIFVVVGGITLVIPLTGLTLPYVAAGGSSLIANWLLAVLVLIISHAANKADLEDSLTDTSFRIEAVRALHTKEREAHV